MKENLKIGNIVIDEDGCVGVVCIRYSDGDLCLIENDAAHPNPKVCTEKEKEKFLSWSQIRGKIRALIG
jgi:hypothetical protein